MRTGEQAADETAADINDQIGGFLTPALLAFAGAALLVGAFIIFNTFTITVAERTREFAMLRTLGATRRQILGAVALEALVIGVIASLAGLALGLLFAKGLGALFEAVGLGMPTSGLELAPRTIVVSLIVGVGVTLLAARRPARRATRVPPIAALQRGDQADARHATARWRPGSPALVVAAGRRLLVAGLFGSAARPPAACRPMAVGVVFLFIGVALSARWFVRPLAGAVGWPIERLFARARPAGPRERDAQPGPHRDDRRRADGRPRAGRLRRGVRERHQGVVRRRPSTRVVKADLIVRSETMQPIPAAAADAVAETPGGRGVVERAARPGAGQRQEVERRSPTS